MRLFGAERNAHPIVGARAETKLDGGLLPAAEIGSLSRLLVETSMAGAGAASEQRARLLDIVAMQSRINAAAERNGTSSRLAANQVEAVAAEMDAGGETLQATTQVMETTAQTVIDCSAMMNTFVASMTDVRRMIRLIESIARQTNLLALNAAIASAHAGEHGAAFGVIAQEVRLLANRTSEATVEIAEKIGQMSESASRAEVAMKTGTSAVQASVRKNETLKASFVGMLDRMHEVCKLSAEVAEASDLQVAESAKIATSLKLVDDLAGQATRDADTAAELNMRVVTCTAGLYDWLAQSAGGRSAPFVREREATRHFLTRLDRHQTSLEAARELFRQTCAAAGPAAVRGSVLLADRTVPALHFGSHPMAEAEQWVDAVHRRTGCVATIFVKSGERFLRVATNVKRGDGQRATGTSLNPEGLAVDRLLRGESYMGAVYILGKPFLACYDPAFSPDGELIGALYVGHAIDWEGRDPS